ncbi:MAG: hypothetical protein ACKO9B_14940 [Planctomycetota bacterium]
MNHAAGRVAGIVMVVVVGCAPPAKKTAATSTQQPIETRKTIGKTTQNVLPLADALQQGGQLAEMSITSGGLGAITSDAYRTSVGKMGIIAVEHQLQLVEAEHGPKPMNYDEFMAKVIGKGKPDGIQLPMLPYYQEWAYDPEAKKLVVVEFPLKKEQRQQETTGASGL